MVNPNSDLVLIEFSLNDRYTKADNPCATIKLPVHTHDMSACAVQHVTLQQ